MKFRSPLLAAWFALLALVVLCTAGRALDDASRQPEFVAGCDSFGYLSMAREVRHAWAERRLPRFALASQQSEELVRELSRSGLSPASWDHLVGPHAYYYAPGSGRTIPQYPPGTALAVAPFREGNAVFSLERVDAGVTVLAALALLAFCFARGSWVSAGWVALAAVFAVRLPVVVGDRSFSVEALVIPCLAGSALAALAWERASASGPGAGPRSSRQAVVLAACAGAFLGLSILCRLPCALFLPGLVLPFLVLGRRGLPAAAALAGGVFVFGLLPLFVHQAALTGHFYLPTYSAEVVTLQPSGKLFLSNLSYYLGHGQGAGFNWVPATLIVSVPGALALGAIKRRRELALAGAAALATWAIPTAYFLLYQVQEPYYLAASTLASAVFFVTAATRLEATSVVSAQPARQSKFRVAALAWTLLAVWPALSVAPTALKESALPRRSEVPPVELAIPPVLRNPRNWVWADYYSGTLTYFGGHAAFKLPFSTAESRSVAFSVARDPARGGPQFLVEDSPSMIELAREFEARGARLTLIGKVEPYPYFSVEWPTRPDGSASSARPDPGKTAARD
jgi:hypothetical protein